MSRPILSVLLIVALVVAACGEAPEFDGWCYTFVFNGLDRTPESLIVTEGTVTEVGIDSVEIAENQWSIIFEFEVLPFVQVDDIRFQIFNWTDPLVTVTAAATGTVFGQSANLEGDLDLDDNQIWIPGNVLDDFVSGRTVEVTIQADGPISLYQLQVGGDDDVSPFGADDCAPATATPSATITATLTHTPVPTETFTPTPVTHTPTPSPTPEPVCVTDWEIDLSNYSSTSLTPSDTSREYWQFDLGSPVEFYIDSPWPGYEFSVSAFDFYSGSYWDGSTNGYSAEAIRVYLWLEDGSVDVYDEHLFPTGGSNGADKITATSDGGDIEGIALGATHPSWGTWAVAKPNPRGFRFQEVETANSYTLDELVWVAELNINACRGDYLGDPPTATPTVTNTPTPTATRTPIAGTFVYTPSPGTPAPTPWPWTTATVTPWATNTPIPVAPSNTPGPSPTPLPTSTFIATSTQLPVPTFETTGTAIPTWVIGEGSPIPQITAIFTGQPLPDVTIQATNLGTIPTVSHRSEVYWFLATADAQVAQLPSSIGAYIPDLSGGGAELFGYTKWMVSGVSIQEIFGPTFAPHGFHAVVAFTIVIVGSLIMLGLRIVKLMLKIALWLINQVLKLIPGLG